MDEARPGVNEAASEAERRQAWLRGRRSDVAPGVVSDLRGDLAGLAVYQNERAAELIGHDQQVASLASHQCQTTCIVVCEARQELAGAIRPGDDRPIWGVEEPVGKGAIHHAADTT